MAETLQERILQDVLATLTAIDADATGSPYFYTIGPNQVVLADAAVVEPGIGPFPYLVAAAGDTAVVSDSMSVGQSHVIERLELIVVGHLADPTNVRRNLRRLEHDIRAALWEDPYRGDLAHSTWWESSEFFYPLPNESASQVATHWSIQYEVRLSDLTATN